MSFQQRVEILSREERFKATVYAMNSLLIQKGIYSQGEFEQLFTEWAEKERTRLTRATTAQLPTSTS